MLQALIFSNISIEAVILSIIVFLCITTFGMNVFARQQIISQKHAHENRMQKLQVQILKQKTVFKDNIVVEQENIKRQKAILYKMDTLKKKCLHLYQLTRQLNI